MYNSTVHTGWIVDQGGVTSYIAKDEDEEVRLHSTLLDCMCTVGGKFWYMHSMMTTIT